MQSSVIVSFSSTTDRQTFLAKAEHEWPELLRHLFLPRRRPDAIFESLSESDVQRLHQFAEGHGRVHDDIKFETFAPADEPKSGS